MNVDDLFIKLLPGLGSGGVIGLFLWMLIKRFFADTAKERELLEAARKEAMEAQNSRITAMERSHAECEKDRTKLWERLLEQYGHTPLPGPRGPLT